MDVADLKKKVQSILSHKRENDSKTETIMLMKIDDLD